MLLCCRWLAPIASAEDYHGDFGVGRGYVFRGLELNDGEVSYHGYLEVESETGLYAGIWVGSYDLKFDDSRDTEINYVLGFSRRIAPQTSIDTAIVHYQYPGAEGTRNYDWTEWLTSLHLGSQWIIAYGLGENWLADSELTHSLELIYQYPMPLELNLDISAGKVIAENTSLGNYRYMGAGISRTIGPIGIRFAISTTNDQAEQRLGNSIAGTHSTIQISWAF